MRLDHGAAEVRVEGWIPLRARVEGWTDDAGAETAYGLPAVPPSCCTFPGTASARGAG